MNHVTSGDGTKIAYERGGNGPSLVLVHGTATDHSYWAPVLPHLERHFTVYTVDRRGRGQSGDTEPYAIQREFNDLATLVGSIDGPVHLLGHSYGALCSLEAALLARNVHKLALYEPPIYTTVDVVFPRDVVDRFDALLRAGHAEQAVSRLGCTHYSARAGGHQGLQTGYRPIVAPRDADPPGAGRPEHAVLQGGDRCPTQGAAAQQGRNPAGPTTRRCDHRAKPLPTRNHGLPPGQPLMRS
jgi:pimeloyl-ACP methyl ester carboxylesterase